MVPPRPALVTREDVRSPPYSIPCFPLTAVGAWASRRNCSPARPGSHQKQKVPNGRTRTAPSRLGSPREGYQAARSTPDESTTPGRPTPLQGLSGAVLQKIRYNRSPRASAFPPGGPRDWCGTVWRFSPGRCQSTRFGKGDLWHRTLRSRSATAPQGQRKCPIGQILGRPIRCPLGQTLWRR